MSLTPVVMSWSGGKDSCLALHEIQKTQNYRVSALLTTVTRDYDRISMHGDCEAFRQVMDAISEPVFAMLEGLAGVRIDATQEGATYAALHAMEGAAAAGSDQR